MMNIKHLILTAALLATGNAIAAGSIEAGEKKADTCMGCHAVKSYFNVYPSYKVPKLGGQHAAYIEAALKAYRGNERAHPTMQANAGNLSDQDIADIAAYFASKTTEDAEANAPQNADLVAKGKEKSASCAACHGAEGVSANPTWPTLAGQYASYLENSLAGYKNGLRKNAIMSGMAAGLSDEDIEALAAYYSSLPGLKSLALPKNFSK